MVICGVLNPLIVPEGMVTSIGNGRLKSYSYETAFATGAVATNAAAAITGERILAIFFTLQIIACNASIINWIGHLSPPQIRSAESESLESRDTRTGS